MIHWWTEFSRAVWWLDSGGQCRLNGFPSVMGIRQDPRSLHTDIERLHRGYYAHDSNTKKPPTLIFSWLWWQDNSAILKGAHKAYPLKHALTTTLLFFPNFSLTTLAKRKSFSYVTGLEPILTYLTVMKIEHGGKDVRNPLTCWGLCQLLDTEAESSNTAECWWSLCSSF